MGAICAGENCLFAASQKENMIWQFHPETFAPMAVFSGGPGISQLMLSRDEKRLYALCSEADSLLMIHAQSGMPLMLARAGVNPCAMAIDERGETIAVAGGACGEVLLLCAKTLALVGQLDTCGVVFSVVVAQGHIFALSLTETMDSVLTTFLPSGIRKELPLCGMPGALCVMSDCIAAATHLGMFMVAMDGSRILGQLGVPGRAGRLLVMPEGMLLTDMWSDSLFWCAPTGRQFIRVAEGARDVLCLKSFDEANV